MSEQLYNINVNSANIVNLINNLIEDLPDILSLEYIPNIKNETDKLASIINIPTELISIIVQYNKKLYIPIHSSNNDAHIIDTDYITGSDSDEDYDHYCKVDRNGYCIKYLQNNTQAVPSLEQSRMVYQLA